MDNKSKLEKLTLDELLSYEKALRVLLQQYDNDARVYNGYTDERNGLKKLTSYGNMRLLVLSAIENKINNLFSE